MPRRGPPGPARLGLGLGTLAASALVQALAGDPEVAVLFGLAFTGIGVAHVAGLPAPLLGKTALGLAAVIWATALLPLPGPARSAAAHLAAGALIGWLLARSSAAGPTGRAPRVWLVVPALVLAIGVLWEVGELFADIFAPVDVRPRDVVVDLAADLVGALVGVAAAKATATTAGPADGRPPARGKSG